MDLCSSELPVQTSEPNGRKMRRGYRESAKMCNELALSKTTHVAICGRLRACIAARDQSQHVTGDSLRRCVLARTHVGSRRPIRCVQVANRDFVPCSILTCRWHVHRAIGTCAEDGSDWTVEKKRNSNARQRNSYIPKVCCSGASAILSSSNSGCGSLAPASSPQLCIGANSSRMA